MKKENKQERKIKPSDEEVAIQAYQLWEQEGRPAGRDFDHWVKAKTQLNASAEVASAHK